MSGVRASLALVALSAILGSVAVARGATPATSDGRTRMTERVPSLKKRLEEATKDLTYTSETDAPVEPFEMKGFEGEKVGPADLLAFLKRDASTPVAEKSADDFFSPLTEEQDWYGDEEKAVTARFAGLRKLLEDSLSDVRVFRVGDRDVDYYVVGRSKSGEFAGVHTKAVET